MPKYTIHINYGYGDEYEEIEAKNEPEAEKIAYARWLEEAENQADYRVIGLATDELREEYL